MSRRCVSDDFLEELVRTNGLTEMGKQVQQSAQDSVFHDPGDCHDAPPMKNKQIIGFAPFGKP